LKERILEELQFTNAELAIDDPAIDNAIHLWTKEQKYKEANEIFKEILRNHPTNLRATSEYSIFLDNAMHDYDAAGGLHVTLLQIDPVYAFNLPPQPHNIDPFHRRCMIMWASQKVRDAFFNEHPENPIVLLVKAVYLFKQKKSLDEAEEVFQKLQKMDPNNCRVLLEYATFQLFQKNVTKAEKLLKTILEKDKNYYPAALKLGILYWKTLNRIPEAEAFLKKSAESGLPRNLYYLAWFMDTQLGDNAAAEPLYKAVVNSGWNFSLAFTSYAKFLDLRLLKPNSAREYYEMGTKALPTLSVTHLLYAEYLRRTKNYDEAEEFFKKSIQIRETVENLMAYAYFLKTIRKAEKPALELVERSSKINKAKTDVLSKHVFKI